jgi:hypothetical protein
VFGHVFWVVVSLFFLWLTIQVGTPDGDGISVWTWLGLIIWAGWLAVNLRNTVHSFIIYRAMKNPDNVTITPLDGD